MRTSKADFRFYVAECQRLIKLWGINDWRVEFEHSPSDDARGWLSFDSRGRAATIGLATTMDKKPTKELLQDIAEHEVVHLLLAPISHLANVKKRPSAEEYTTAAEATTRRVQAVIRGLRCR